jgi:hypothetical protein
MKTQVILFGVGLLGATAEALAATSYWFQGVRCLVLIKRERILKSVFNEHAAEVRSEAN